MSSRTDDAGMHPELAYREKMTDPDHYRIWSPGYPTYAPWHDRAQICTDLDDVEILTLNEHPRLYYLASFARHAAGLGSAIAECGVFRGGTALLMARVTADAGTPLHLFDSFEGLSEPDAEHDVFYRRGDFAFPDPESVTALLHEAGPRVRVYKGWIPEVFTAVPEPTSWALVHVDVDLFRPTAEACAFFYPRVVPGGVLIFDEYGFPTCRGERNAVDEFFAGRPETPVVLPTGQAFVIKQ